MGPKFWFAVGAGIAALSALIVAAVLWFRSRAPDAKRVLRTIALDHLRAVLVPDGMGGHIHVEHLLLTADGLLVVDVKNVNGVVFASDRMTDWTVMGREGRFSFPNPQGNLYDRVAAVRQLVRDIPVAGYVLFSAGADFSKGRPKDVILPAELLERYAKPERSEIDRKMHAFAPHWEQVREAVKPVEP